MLVFASFPIQYQDSFSLFWPGVVAESEAAKRAKGRKNKFGTNHTCDDLFDDLPFRGALSFFFCLPPGVACCLWTRGRIKHAGIQSWEGCTSSRACRHHHFKFGTPFPSNGNGHDGKHASQSENTCWWYSTHCKFALLGVLARDLRQISGACVVCRRVQRADSTVDGAR